MLQKRININDTSGLELWISRLSSEKADLDMLKGEVHGFREQTRELVSFDYKLETSQQRPDTKFWTFTNLLSQRDAVRRPLSTTYRACLSADFTLAAWCDCDTRKPSSNSAGPTDPDFDISLLRLSSSGNCFGKL